MKNIQSIVKTTNISIDKNRSVSEAIEVIYKNHEGTVIVLDHDDIVGILTERDIIDLLDEHIDFGQPVINVAAKKVISININRSIEYALHVLIDNNIRRLSVINDDGTFVGVITQDILMNKLEKEHYRVNLRISQVLSNTNKNIITLPLQSTIEDAVSQMSKNKIGAILISDHTEIMGIITERDLIRLVSRSVPMDSPLDKIMTLSVISVNINDIVHNVVNMMQERHIRRVLVKDENNHPVGLVDIHDIVKNIKGNYGLFIESKLKYTKLALNTINEVIFELNIDKDTTLIQWGNHAALQQYSQEVIDRSIDTLIDPDIWSNVHRTLLAEGKISDHKIKIGSKYYLVSCNYYEEGTSEQSFLLVCKDVTEYENYLTRGNDIWMKRERMELALTGSKTSVLDWDLITNSCYLPPSWKNMLGFTDEELPNTLSTWKERAHRADIKNIFSSIRQTIGEKKKYFESKHRLKHKDGHSVWILGRAQILYDENGKAVRMIGTDTDITEEKELQLNYSKQVQIIEQIHDAVISTDIRGYISSWNRGAERLLEYSSNEIIGEHITKIYVEKDYDSFQENLDILGYQGQNKVTIALLKKSNNMIYVQQSCSLLKNEKEKPIGMIISCTNITEQKKAEDEIRHLNENLQQEVSHQLERIREKDILLMQQSRMAQMGEMISMIAHQWRQPLAAISATSASMELKASLNKLDNNTVQQKAQDISAFSQHLSKTIDDFRDFFKPNKKKVETSYCNLLKSVLEIIAISIENKNIKLIRELNCHDKFITYPNELKQVILNLIKNAEDALIENKIENPYIKICTYTKNDQYILEVSDNGGGIPKETIEYIFDPYFSTKTKKDGTGLGLYMSKTIIEEHCGGELNAENTKDGALFKIILHKILPLETQ